MVRGRTRVPFLLFLIVSCTPRPAPRSAVPAPASPPAAAPRAVAPAVAWADSVLATLSLRDKAAQMVWPQILGEYAPADGAGWQRIRAAIVDEHVGGFIVSVGSPIEIAAKIDAMQRMSALPLLIGADYETGAGFRARGGIFIPNGIDLGGATIFPPQMAIGATRDTALAYEQGRITAIEGRALGVHFAYSPVLDVNNNPDNPVINTRSFSENPQLAARLGVALVRGIQEHGMIATGKHFPGHGDTGVNSHLALATVTASRARLDTLELVPFRAAIAAGVGAMMTFHGSMPGLDSSGVPGTLSAPVLRGLLREELGFRGFIVSDAMDMRGVLDTYGLSDATKRAVAAGADILLQPVDVRQTVDAILDGVREGRYDEARLDTSVRMILEMKQRMGLDRDRRVNLDSTRASVGTVAHQAIARTAADRSITLVKDSLDQIPLRGDSTQRLLLVTVARPLDLTAGLTMAAELRRRYRELRHVVIRPDASPAEFATIVRTADSAGVVIVGSYISHSNEATTVAATKGFIDFVRALIARGRTPILVAHGNPYLLMQTPGVPAYMVAWGGFPVSQGAAARALLGTIPITGRLPITIPGLAAFGAGIQRPAR